MHARQQLQSRSVRSGGQAATPQRPARRSAGRLPAGKQILAEQYPEQRANQRLDKEQLGEEGKREVEADELSPVGQQGEHVEARIVRIVQERGDQAHGRAHQAHRGADDGGFKQDGVRLAGVKVLRRQPEGAGAAHRGLQQEGQAELCQHHGPNGQEPAAHIHTALAGNRRQNAGFAGHGHQCGAVHDIQAVEHISVDRKDHGEQGKDDALECISWHGQISPFLCA